MSRLAWYWHRLRAMGPGEIARHALRKFRQAVDSRRTSWPTVDLTCPGVHPKVPRRNAAPESVRTALRRDTDDILAGRWRFFGHLTLQVDDPPQWQFDYLAGRSMESTKSAFGLDYRTLPDGVDSKLIWEPSRWQQFVRLAMAAHVLGDGRAAEKCVSWLEDWVRHNPPYRGWNWTSALEVGLRLVQFTWIDALLEEPLEGHLRFKKDSREASHESHETEGETPWPTATAPTLPARMVRLREEILPPHVWYAWRHRSFGSSANNHLLGELAGCIVAIARWPGLAKCAASLETLGAAWRNEVFAQFAEDGGNREQALNYHLFSWELCWQAFKALEAAGRLSGQIEQRLAYASRFFTEVQVGEDPWDYGDSDNASVVPFFISCERAVAEWHQWFTNARLSPGLSYWLGEPPASLPPFKAGQPLATVAHGDWWYYPDSGMAVAESGFWKLRWDLSPLGYLATAAHGHLDALHVSIWMKGVALIIDPGTGAYHANKPLRNWLASREAHNSPCLLDVVSFPKRLGPFLWGAPHEMPSFKLNGTLPIASLPLSAGTLRRSIRRLPTEDGWEVADASEPGPGQSGAFVVRWQLAPGAWVKRRSERQFEVHRGNASVLIELDENWVQIELCEPVAGSDPGSASDAVDSMDGLVSPAFRKAVRAPVLKLLARPSCRQRVVFTTIFRTSHPMSTRI